jgi:hypothetical protein
MAEGARSGSIRTAMAVFLGLLTLIMIGGILGATFGMWLPRILS